MYCHRAKQLGMIARALAGTQIPFKLYVNVSFGLLLPRSRMSGDNEQHVRGPCSCGRQ